MLRLSLACVVVLLLLSIPFTHAYRPVVSSLILCMIGGLLKHICHTSSNLKRINTLSGGGVGGGRGRGGISFKTVSYILKF